MDFKELWDRYLSEDITTISDTIIEVFNQKLPDNIEEEYDLGELLAEFSGHHETSKKYDKIEAFAEVLKNKQPKLYEEEGGYINEGLITYYCFLKEKDKLKIQVEDAIARDYDYDVVLEGFKQLLYNNHIDLVNYVIEKEYENVKNSPKLIGGAEFDLALPKFYIELEQFFLTQKENDPIDSSHFQKNAEIYSFEFGDNFVNIESGLFKDISDTLPKILKKFPKNRTAAMLTLEMNFLKMMSQKNCSFPISGTIWSKLHEYFEDKRSTNWQNYFSFKSSSFREFLNRQRGFFSSNAKAVLLLWGSSYVLDFLHQNQIILDSKYTAQKKMIEGLKQEFKETNKYGLWEFNFIHAWEPAQGTEAEKWKAEKQEFEDSYALERDSNEKSKFGFDKLFGKPFMTDDKVGGSSKTRTIKINNRIKKDEDKPVRIKGEKRMGRNVKVTVKYKDGTIKEDVKYKKVMNDIDNGLCEIV